ncbi:hypothetical protein [Paenibacillus eucommiae]|uniref:Uncharacterized protein n=1 Tax=Paenibacillus eucommiae TaxID=1355755 RepID=A0ABS4J297_9BACL|nr:hypothetical protein [Paenibacillus eucommiae]MBP1993930.1 hypothetical protein [Paenibacillus eucommiae]
MDNFNKNIDMYPIKSQWLFGINKIARQLDQIKSRELRNKVIENFINTNHEYFHNYINRDEAYLWDMIKNELIHKSQQVSLDYINKNFSQLKDVFIQWDFDILKIGKEYVFEADFHTIILNINKFPKDLYIFDESVNWMIIQTHECLNINGDNWMIIQL